LHERAAVNRSTVIPIIGVLLALVILFFIFFASRPDPNADVVGDGGGLEEAVQPQGAVAPDDEEPEN
jgi:hypothetical protein